MTPNALVRLNQTSFLLTSAPLLQLPSAHKHTADNNSFDSGAQQNGTATHSKERQEDCQNVGPTHECLPRERANEQAREKGLSISQRSDRVPGLK